MEAGPPTYHQMNRSYSELGFKNRHFPAKLRVRGKAVQMVVTKEREMRFKTPLGLVLVCGLGAAGGWHFVLIGARSQENYYSAEGRVFSRASVYSPNLLVHSEEVPDRKKVKLLRMVWEKYIWRFDLDAPDWYPDIVAVS
jgi:hypothetical protein